MIVYRFIATLIILVCAVSSAGAQTPGITKLDINTGAGSSFPLHITSFGSKVCCYGNEDNKGWELHTTDGITKPSLVQDIYPLSTSCIGFYFNRPMAELSGKLYFTADNGASGYELFVYDGSSLPSIAKDIEFGAIESSPDDYTVLGTTLYFRASTSTEGYELWSYQPSGSVLTRLTDLNPGTDSSLRGGMIAFNNKIYFAADTGAGNTELYEYDPISTNTTMVADINPGTSASMPLHFTTHNNKLYFSADDGNYGRELFEYDGTNPPVRISDIAVGSVSSIPAIKEPVIASFAGKIYLTATNGNSNYNLYRMDAGNTSVLSAAINGTGNSNPIWLTPYGGKLYFSAYNDTLGFELWACDSSNTSKLAFELCPGLTGTEPQYLLAVGDDLYFRGNDCLNIGEELFKFSYKKLSVQRMSLNADVKLYPNPASSFATLEVNTKQTQTLHVSLKDIVGKELYTTPAHNYTTGTHKIQIPLGHLAAGTYIYTLYNTEGAAAMGKLTVE